MHPLRQNGFSLIEILVAFSIMALSLTMISKTLASNTRSISNLERQQHAIVLAEGIINSKTSIPPEGWNDEGTSGPYRWKVSSTREIEKNVRIIKPINITLPTGEKTKEVDFFKVDIQILWKDGAKERAISNSVLLPVAKYS